jgi:hypothetical protein
VIIAGAGGAAHLPGMIAAKTLVPVLGVPVPATLLNGIDSILSIVQMPRGVPVGTLAIGKPGAVNAALLAAQIVSTTRHTASPETAQGSATSGFTVTGIDGHLRKLEEIEHELIRFAIEKYDGHMSEVARRLGIGRSTLYRKLREMGIDDQQAGAA